MQIDLAQTHAIQHEVATLVARIEGQTARLAELLSAPPPRDAAALNRICAEVSILVQQFQTRLPLHIATQTKLRAAAELAGPTPVRMPPPWHDLNTELSRQRTRLQGWYAMRDLIAAQVRPKRRPLYARKPDQHDPAVVCAAASDRIARQLHAVLNPVLQDTGATDLGCFSDIPYPESWFLEHALAARRISLAQGRSHPLGFIDIGCGGGTKVVAARQMFGRCDGLEYDPGYGAAARHLIARSGVSDCRIIEGDALQFDGYGNYDVLFAFRPMRDDTAMARLEARIVAGAKHGALLIAPYAGFTERLATLNCVHVAGAIHAIGLTARQARQLARDSTQTGTALEGEAQFARRGAWERILRASMANGFALPVSNPLAGA